MRLEKHLPNFVSELIQFKEIDKTHTIELDRIDDRLLEIQNNQFVMAANNNGLSRYETMLDILPDVDTDVRRYNILSKFNSSIPFSMRWLLNMLNSTVGVGMFLIELDNLNYRLNVSIVESKSYIIENLKKDLRRKLPANLIINFTTLSSINSKAYAGFIVRTADKIKL